MPHFKDHFTDQAGEYSRYRPRYPLKLFQFLASLTTGHARVWDCATGNGQAAVGLAPFYDHILATDASEKQIANAIAHPKIVYRVAAAEEADIEPGSVDLVVVAQALHWFNVDRFYEEVRRVLKPGGVIGVWCYGLLRISPPLDEVTDGFYTGIVGPFWPPERKLVDEGYRSISFPFDEEPSPDFHMEASWNLEQLVGYLRTWSSVQRFKRKNGFDPLELILEDLETLWGAPAGEKLVRWPIHLRIGRLPGATFSSPPPVR